MGEYLEGSEGMVHARELRILIVDDSEQMRGAMRELIRPCARCSVVGEGANGLEAIGMAHQLRPDLVIMDIRMPVMGGLEAMRRLRFELPEMRIVLMTSEMEVELREESLRWGVQACLEKGADLWRELKEIISASLGALEATPMKAEAQSCD